MVREDWPSDVEYLAAADFAVVDGTAVHIDGSTAVVVVEVGFAVAVGIDVLGAATQQAVEDDPHLLVGGRAAGLLFKQLDGKHNG